MPVGGAFVNASVVERQEVVRALSDNPVEVGWEPADGDLETQRDTWTDPICEGTQITAKELRPARR